MSTRCQRGSGSGSHSQSHTRVCFGLLHEIVGRDSLTAHKTLPEGLLLIHALFCLFPVSPFRFRFIKHPQIVNLLH